jgi:hypothetical protein
MYPTAVTASACRPCCPSPRHERCSFRGRVAHVLSQMDALAVKQLTVCVVGALASLTGMPLFASTTCQVRIDQIQGVKREFQVSFEPRLPDARMAQRRHFDLPDGDGKCTLAFFGKGSGASLSCELDPAGVTYVQSDRTTIKEYPAKNEITFRLSRAAHLTGSRGIHYTVETDCK